MWTGGELPEIGDADAFGHRHKADVGYALADRAPAPDRDRDREQRPHLRPAQRGSRRAGPDGRDHVRQRRHGPPRRRRDRADGRRSATASTATPTCPTRRSARAASTSRRSTTRARFRPALRGQARRSAPPRRGATGVTRGDLGSASAGSSPSASSASSPRSPSRASRSRPSSRRWPPTSMGSTSTAGHSAPSGSRTSSASRSPAAMPTSMARGARSSPESLAFVIGLAVADRWRPACRCSSLARAIQGLGAGRHRRGRVRRRGPRLSQPQRIPGCSPSMSTRLGRARPRRSRAGSVGRIGPPLALGVRRPRRSRRSSSRRWRSARSPRCAPPTSPPPTAGGARGRRAASRTAACCSSRASPCVPLWLGAAVALAGAILTGLAARQLLPPGALRRAAAPRRCHSSSSGPRSPSSAPRPTSRSRHQRPARRARGRGARPLRLDDHVDRRLVAPGAAGARGWRAGLVGVGALVIALGIGDCGLVLLPEMPVWVAAMAWAISGSGWASPTRPSAC